MTDRGRPRFACIPVLLIVAVAAISAQNAPRPTPSTAQGEWPTYGGDLAASKYSPLDQINRDNFAKLKVAWRTKSPDAVLSLSLPGGGEWTADFKQVFAELNRLDPKRWRDAAAPFVTNFKATPLMVGGTLYLNSPLSIGMARRRQDRRGPLGLQPEELRGRHDDDERAVEPARRRLLDRRHRGARVLGHRRRLPRSRWTPRPAVPIPTFGTNGRVDLMEGLPRAKRGERDYLNALTYSVQSPPFVVRDLVITPASISSLDHQQGADSRLHPRLRRAHRQGPLDLQDRADARRVRQRHVGGRFLVVRRQGHRLVDDERGRRAGHGCICRPTPWRPTTTAAIGPATTCLPRASCASTSRPGTRVWHFQTVHHGLWDYDNPTAPNLLDITVNGTRVKALAQITKQGFVYTLNRETGEPIWPIEERPVPPSDVPGEKASPTQPFPTRPPAFERQGVTIDDLVDFTPEIRAMAVEAIKPFKIGPLFTPPSLQGTIMQPGRGGRRQLVRRGGRSGDRDALRAVEAGLERHPARGAADAEPRRQSELPAGHAAQPEHARRPAAAQAAVLADHRDQHEHRANTRG